jgi:diguanylate cyclase (GGDEF)-like protein/PAS domain S-box-containing protein
MCCKSQWFWSVLCLLEVVSRRVPGRALTFTLAAVAFGAGLALSVAAQFRPDQTVEFCGLLLAAMLVSARTPARVVAVDHAVMSPSFLVEFTSLLLFGPGPTMLVAAAAAILQGRVARSGRVEPSRVLLNVVTAAGIAYRALGGTAGQFVWPAQGVPIAAALVAYSLVTGVSAQVGAPFIAGRPIGSRWPMRILKACPMYFVGAALAVGFVEAVQHQLWNLVPVAAVPLYVAYRAYSDYVGRLEDEHRRREVIGSLREGMCIVDESGRVSLWSDTLAHLLKCPRERVLGRALGSALPALRDTGLPRAIDETLRDRAPRTVSNLRPGGSGSTALQVQLVPVAGGVAALWRDVTEWAHAEQTLKRSAERLALAADGANDGLWEWDLRTQELFVSARWKEILGLPGDAPAGRPETWLDRVHPEDRAGLTEALRAHGAGETPVLEHEHRIRREDGEYRWFLCRGVSGGGRQAPRIGGSLTDTTERVAARERLRLVGFLDPLTGLRNRADFVDELGRRLDELKRRPAGRPFAVLYLDLDRFKVVNDSLGHLVGDELLVAVSRRLESCLRDGDTLGRLGGDEFAILLNTLADEGQANAIAFRIQEALSAPCLVGGREVFTSVSIGIAFGKGRYANPDEIMRDADTAMYHAKSRGKARHELFDADMHARARDRLGLENDLRHAVDNCDFHVAYQPIVLLDSRRCVGFESLVRWTRNGESISPATFVPVAEELGLIEQVGTWVLQQACLAFGDWQRRFPHAGLDYITVNASSRQLTQQTFLHDIELALQAARMPPSALRIEITETALMDNPHHAAKVLAQLRDFGVKIYLDDFGTGCSSLSHLHRLPVDALKIDRSFVRSLVLPERPAIVESILALARTMQTGVVAEGIESEIQAQELERLGCTHAQGFLFSRPLSKEAAEALLDRNQPLGPASGAIDDVAARAVDRAGVAAASLIPLEDERLPNGVCRL